MHVSLNPTYYCNFRCPFCYLGDRLSDKTTISIDHINDRLSEVISHGHDIESIDIYGGEILSLGKDYQRKLIESCMLYSENIRVTTNLSLDYSVLLEYPVQVCVSYDYKARQSWERVIKNMHEFPKELHVLMLASHEFLKQDPVIVLDSISKVPNLQTVEIKPYSTNQYNQENVTHRDFEECVKRYIEHGYMLGGTELVNIEMIEYALSGEANSFSDDHIYITPDNKFAVLDFDENDNESFTEIGSFEEYKDWTQVEKLKMAANRYCNQCEYFGSCLSEHLRDVVDLTNSCSGYKGLLDWYLESKSKGKLYDYQNK